MVVLHPLDTLVQRCLRYLSEVSDVCQMDHEPIRIVALDSVASVVGKECFDMIVAEIIKRWNTIYSTSKIEIHWQVELIVDRQFVGRL